MGLTERARQVYYGITYRKMSRDFEDLYEKNNCRIEDNLLKKSTYELFITNSNQGGTKSFENNYLKDKNNVIILRCLFWGDFRTIGFQIENRDENVKSYLKIDEIKKVFEYDFDRIDVNSLIGIENYEEIIKILSDYKESHSPRYTYFIHDYHCICPNVNLFLNGKYCKLNCEKCVDRNYLQIQGREVRISEWRRSWSCFLKLCDEIRCFSHSSKEIVSNIYKSVDIEKITVVPHDTSFIKFTPINGVDKLPLHIGVVGQCMSPFKGKYAVIDMIKRYGDVMSITLVGSDLLHYRIIRKKVKYLGRYNHDDLQSIIEKEKISCVVFPSLCPETFSYMVSELIAMDLPIICFNYGAQAEKCSTYDKGIIVSGKEELYSLINDMEAAGTWQNYVDRHQNYHTEHPIISGNTHNIKKD